MSYKDFCKYFTDVDVCRILYPNIWKNQLIEGYFSKELKTSGFILS
jgi:hypothetical protein